MGATAAALLPIITPIFLGFVLRRTRFLSDEAWAGMERLTYFVLFPCLLVRTLGTQTLVGVPWADMLGVVAGTLAVAAVVLVLWHRLTASVADATFTSIFQGGVRFNTYIALAVAEAFFGAEGLAMGAVVAGFMIVVINLLCISAFAIWGSAAIAGAYPFVRAVLGNPLILACTAGWALSLSSIGLAQVPADMLEVIGRAALPFGLLAVGAALQPEAIRAHYRAALIASVIQFGLKPLTAFLLISATGLDGAVAGALAIALMAPTAPSGYILARQLGGDAPALASIITLQTLLAFVLMPLIAFSVFGLKA